MIRRIRTFLRLPAAERRMLVEALLLFHGFRAAVYVVPFRYLRPILGEPVLEGDVRRVPETAVAADGAAEGLQGPEDGVGCAEGAAPPPEPVRSVRLAMHRASRRHPDTCLARALAARVMLERRGCPSTMTFGVRREDGKLSFHAWLLSQGVAVTGGRAAPGHVPIGSFSVRRTG